MVEGNINQPFHVGVADEVVIQETLVRLMDSFKVASMQEDHSSILRIVLGVSQRKVGDTSRKRLQGVFPLILEWHWEQHGFRQCLSTTVVKPKIIKPTDQAQGPNKRHKGMYIPSLIPYSLGSICADPDN